MKQMVIHNGRSDGRTRRMFRSIAPHGVPEGWDIVYYFQDKAGNTRRVLWRMTGEVVELEPLPGILEEAS